MFLSHFKINLQYTIIEKKTNSQERETWCIDRVGNSCYTCIICHKKFKYASCCTSNWMNLHLVEKSIFVFALCCEKHSNTKKRHYNKIICFFHQSRSHFMTVVSIINLKQMQLCCTGLLIGKGCPVTNIVVNFYGIWSLVKSCLIGIIIPHLLILIIIEEEMKPTPKNQYLFIW